MNYNMKHGTIHLVYSREYFDDEDNDWFDIHYTIFRNVPLSQLNRINDKSFKARVKWFCDNNFKESASNFTGHSEVNMITGDDYYKTYDEEFGEDTTDITGDGASFVEDYAQTFNTRQFFKYDFNPRLTKSLTMKRSDM